VLDGIYISISLRLYNTTVWIPLILIILRHCTYISHGDYHQIWQFLCDPGRKITNSPFGFTSRVSWYLAVLQQVQIRDGLSVFFVWVWTRIWCVIFYLPRSSSGPPLLRLYRRRRLAVTVFACKSGPLPFTNPFTTSCHIWWLYFPCLHRRPQPVHDLCHSMLHTFSFLPIAMNSTPY
jgi:hypothetical protein